LKVNRLEHEADHFVSICCEGYLHYCHTALYCSSRWLCGLRHEASSLARTLRSWVRIPLKAWMSVYTYILCYLVCR
jgi:hypothetical protein